MAFIINRYLIKEVVHSWLWVTLVVWIILLSNQLVRYLGKAVSGEVPAQQVFVLLGLSSVSFLVVLLPLSFYLAIILALGRLYKDSEMAALGACGFGTRQQYGPLFSLALVLAVILAWLSLIVVPSATQLRHQMEDQAERRTDMSLLIPGRFQEIHDGKLVMYAESLSEDGSQITNLFVETMQQGRTGLLTAEHAYFRFDGPDAGRLLVLEAGGRYQGVPGDDDYRIMGFKRHGIRLPSNVSGEIELETESKTTAELWGSNDLEYMAELQWRLSAPIALLTLTLLAVPLSRTTPRQGQYGKVFIGVVAFIVYYNLLGTSRVWIESGTIPPWAGLWWVHGVLLVVTAILLVFRRHPPGPHRHVNGAATSADIP